MEQASDGIAVYGFDGSILDVNDRGCEMLGYTRQELLSLNLADLVDPEDLAHTPFRFTELRTGQVLISERVLVRRDGRRLPVEVSAKLLSDGQGVQAIVRDVSERKEAEAALQREKEFTDKLINGAMLGILAFDRECRYTVWNPGMERITGLTREQVLGRVAFDVFPFLKEIGQDWYIQQALAGNIVTSTNQPYTVPSTGKEGFFESRYSPLHNEEGEVIGGLAVVNDITERKALEEQIAHQAFHDPLTALPNRLLFMDRLAQALAHAAGRGGSVAVLFLDLDDFKVINDSLGHKCGDMLLCEVGKRIEACVRPGDTVARLGGDEFTVLLEGTRSPDDAIGVSERIASALVEPIQIDGHELFVTTSIGIALNTPHSSEPDELLRDADVAMYEAKKSGKSRHAVFDFKMNARAWKRLELESELRRALERGEFDVHYQPVINLNTGRIEEVEALVRWFHPKRGPISPADFIPVAEETGLIIPIGEWVLMEACKQVYEWHKAGDGYRVSGARSADGHRPRTPDPRHPASDTRYPSPDTHKIGLSVNLSVRQFKQPDLVERISAVLHASGLDPDYLKLEITESVALDDTEATITTLDALHRLGIKLAIDDFGTGYSALSYLKKYPVDTLKIDRSFIANLGEDLEDTAIVRALTAFAQTLNLSVTAEGIETPEQLQHLRDLGCDTGQGYLFSRPLPFSELEGILNFEFLILNSELNERVTTS
jgi:diguanylate cyclase (GGDEF)-like protein/PAS domain S-box-containing protein